MTHDVPRIPSLAQADLLLLLARLFGPPSRALGGLDVEAEACSRLLECSGLPEHELLETGLQETILAGRGFAEHEWLAEWTRLFEGGVAVPINETAYVRRDKGTILADIVGFYRAFGLDQAEQVHEKPDHLVSELEFVAYLLVMLAHAPDAEAAEVTREALGCFAREHLGEWLPGFALRLAEMSPAPFYVSLGFLAAAAWKSLSDYHQLEAPTHKVLVCAEDPGTPYECGMAAAGQA